MTKNKDIYKLTRRIAVHDEYALAAAETLYKLGVHKKINFFKNHSMCREIAQFYIKGHTITKEQIIVLKKHMPIFATLLYNNGGLCIGKTKQTIHKKHNTCDRYVTFALSKRTIDIHMPYDPVYIEKIKKLDSPKYISKNKVWRVGLTLNNIEQLDNIGFFIHNDILDWYKKWSYKYVKEINPDKLHINNIKGTLRPFQKQGIAYILSRNGNGIIADAMGLGKTVQGIGIIAKIQKNKKPTLIVCPASLKYNWAKEIKKWLHKPTIYIIEGRPSKDSNNIYDTKFLYQKGDNKHIIFIINYDIVANNVKKEKNKNTGKLDITELKDTGWVSYLIKAFFQIIIFDEAQYLKNKKANRTKACLKLAKKIDKKIALSGTPIENKPVEFYNILNMVNPYLFSNFMSFAKRYCDAKHDGYGWNFNGATNTKELHDIISKACVIRRLKKDVLPELPEKTKVIIPIQINNKSDYNTASKDLVTWLSSQGNNIQASKAQQHEALMRLEALKQLAVKGKLTQCKQWIRDFIDSGEKLVVFATHTSVINSIIKEFGEFNKTKKGIAVKITGADSPKNRQQAVEAFQNNDNCRLFVGNIKAAGVGITLTRAANTCFIELEWTPGLMQQAEDRVHRIGQTNNVTAWYLLARNTIEEDIAELLDKKNKIITAVLDGEDVKNTNLLTTLLKKIA